MKALRTCVKTYRRNVSGAISVLTALSLIVIVGFTAAAVDVGSVYLDTRELQGIVDLAAMSAAANPSRAEEAAAATVRANGWSRPFHVSATIGTYRALVSVPADQRFVAGGQPTDAAQVTITTDADLFFASLFLRKGSMQIARTATAARASLANFSVGSRLLALDGGIANAFLSALTGSRVSLSAMDYEALAETHVDLFSYSEALKARANVTAGSFNDVMSNRVAADRALTALVDVLSDSGHRSAASAMLALAAAADTSPIVPARLIDFGPYGDEDHVNASGAGVSVSALELAMAILELAQGGHQVKLDLAATVPGVAGVTAWLAIGERPANSPWLAITDDDDVVIRTAQTRLYVVTSVAPASGLGAAGIASLTLPIYIELASARAKLAAITCGASPGDDTVDLAVSPSIGEAAVGIVDAASLDDFETELDVRPANIVSAPLLAVQGKADVLLGGDAWQMVHFSAADIQEAAVKTVRTDDLMETATATLLGRLRLTVKGGGLVLPVADDALSTGIRQSLAKVAPPLDTAINGLTALLGVGLGEADVRVNGVRCHQVALVR